MYDKVQFIVLVGTLYVCQNQVSNDTFFSFVSRVHLASVVQVDVCFFVVVDIDTLVEGGELSIYFSIYLLVAIAIINQYLSRSPELPVDMFP